ncbi:MAG: polysaccharide biosynthesis/export family protein [Flavobacteriales bacterium]|nr:polysaccharide biosynthesis/export family protein [Flavobacteriales bacterium]MCB9448859.1 polysaccharide biosynthesis/export family protein [Flavobacteriales bacterium]
MRKLILYLCIITSLTSCRMLNPSFMLRTPANYQFDPTPADTVGILYKIAPNDQLDFRIYTNDGFKLIDITSGGDLNRRQFDNMGNRPYLVEYDGTVKLPILGRTQLSGYTLREAEKLLEDKYAVYYNSPFVVLKITNRRVTIFPGNGSNARVILLENENTTLMEALALAGGISTRGKAHKIKLIRGNPSDPQVFLVDLSKIDGTKDGGIVLQANDIIYVDPTLKISQSILAELTPIIGLITSTLLIYSIFTR